MMLPDELMREIKELRAEVNRIKLFDIPKKSDLGGGGGYVPPNYDLTYLRLDASNDPVTSDLDINGVLVGRGGGNDPESTVVGSSGALGANISGFCNTAIGTYALLSNTTGTHNTAIGLGALYFDVDGGSNVAIGSGSFSYKQTGYSNVAVGFRAGQTLPDYTGLTSANNSIYIGAISKGAQVSNHSNEIVIGYDAIGKGDNTVVLGNDSIANTYLKGNIYANNVLFPVQAATGSAPAYVRGGIYFDTTLSKMRIGGISGWETCTSV